jgi:DNA-binding MarR family transcriptional regulator
LSRRLVVNKTDMTGIIDRLEKAQMVERVAHPNDRRVNMIRVTEKGRELVKKIEPHYMEEIFKLMKGLSKQDMQRLIQGLEKVRENIRTSKML